jgi:hypothetical protein
MGYRRVAMEHGVFRFADRLRRWTSCQQWDKTVAGQQLCRPLQILLEAIPKNGESLSP